MKGTDHLAPETYDRWLTSEPEEPPRREEDDREDDGKRCQRCKRYILRPLSRDDIPERCAKCQEDWDRKMADSMKRR